MAKRQKNIKYSSIKILTGSDLSSRRLALMSVKGYEDGPVIWLTGCVHGDEVGGIAVIQEIFRRLKHTPLKRGALHAFPLMNPVGFEMQSRYLLLNKEEDDLNRCFPGDKKGSLAERIADKIFTTILATKPTLVLDLHNDWIRSIPYTLIDPYPGVKNKIAYDEAKKFAHQTGLVVINEQEDDDDADELRHSLSGAMINHGIPALTLELGGSYIIDEQSVTDGADAIWNILVSLKMVENGYHTFQHVTNKKLNGRILKYSHEPDSQTSGIVRFLVKPGAIINQGEPIAMVYNVFGKHQETIKAQTDAIVLAVSDSAMALPGIPIIALGVV